MLSDTLTSDIDNNRVNAKRFSSKNTTVNDKMKKFNRTTLDDERCISAVLENAQLLTWAFCELQSFVTMQTRLTVIRVTR